MIITVQQAAIRDALSAVSKAVSPKSTLPVLANALLKADNNRLTVSGTNLSIGISRWIDATIVAAGAVTVPHKTLTDLVNLLPGGPVTLDLNPATLTLTIKSGSSKTQIKCIDALDFPPMPAPSGGAVIETDAFIKAVGRTAFAASSNEARPVLQGVKLTAGEMAATDGFRVSVTATDTGASDAIIPAAALVEVCKLAKGSPSITVSASPAGNQAIFQGVDWLLVSQLIDGSFPPIAQIMPKKFTTAATIAAADLIRACKQVEIMARDGNNVVDLEIEANCIKLTGESEERGDAEIVIDATVDGPSVSISFNVTFLRQAAEAVDGNLILQVNDHKTPAMVSLPGDTSFKHVIMPMYKGK